MNHTLMLPPSIQKAGSTGPDKFLQEHLDPEIQHSLTAWIELYFTIHVVGSSDKTIKAKLEDLRKFQAFFLRLTGGDHVDSWTPTISKSFQNLLQQSVSHNTARPYTPATINRTMATVRHFGGWLNKQRPLMAGSPLAGVRDIVTDHPDWAGLTDIQVTRLKSACDYRLHACRRRDQSALLETTIFYVLLNTGLREAELCALDLDQYHHKGFHRVIRKGKRIQKKVPVPSDARKFIDIYLESRGDQPGPLLLNRYGERISVDTVQRVCRRLSRQASALLPDEKRFHLHPHQLRHTFLKRVADKHGVHAAQEMSGNVNSNVIFRYTKPGDKEMERISENLFL